MYDSTFARTIRNGGGTFDPESLADVTSGYAVAIVDGTYIKVRLDNDERLTQMGYQSALQSLYAEYPDAYLGTWIDGDTIHVDPVTVVDNEHDAIAIARANNQLAYYVIHEQREVRL